MTTLTQRIQNGSGEDRELDAAIARQFGGDPLAYPEHPSTGTGRRFLCPHYCTDLNAVFALVERELPGWKVAMYDIHDTAERFAYVWPGADVDIPTWEPDWDIGHDGYCDHPRAGHGRHPDRCYAILLAILAAKESRP